MPHCAVALATTHQRMIAERIEGVPAAWTAKIRWRDAQTEPPLQSDREKRRLDLPAIAHWRSRKPSASAWERDQGRVRKTGTFRPACSTEMIVERTIDQ